MKSLPVHSNSCRGHIQTLIILQSVVVFLLIIGSVWTDPRVHGSSFLVAGQDILNGSDTKNTWSVSSSSSNRQAVAVAHDLAIRSLAYDPHQGEAWLLLSTTAGAQGDIVRSLAFKDMAGDLLSDRSAAKKAYPLTVVHPTILSQSQIP